MLCGEGLIQYLSWGIILVGVAFFSRQRRIRGRYGRYVEPELNWRTCPAKAAWFVQELPAFLVPAVLLLTTDSLPGMGRSLFLWTYCLHYFQRTFIYSFLTKGRPLPLKIMVSAVIFCSVNGYLQGHYMLHCAVYDQTWLADSRLVTGLLMFFLGMAINIHSDHILRSLRKPGEVTYKIPKGGMFEYVSGANYSGEILEWCGYAVATWSFPAFAFAFFTICSIGPRAYHHHRFYMARFSDYPKSRKAMIPFIL